MEGFSTEDDGLALSQAATEIADLIAYRGGRGSRTATQVHVKQFKYSVASADVPVRAADAAKTVKKFAATFRDLVEALGRDAALAKLRFSYITNRPISEALAQALVELQAGTQSTTGGQAETIRRATGLTGEDLQAFTARVSFEGASGSVRGVEAGTQMRLAAWGPARDTLARLRFLELQKLVRDKAGMDGQGANLLTVVDVLGALGIPDESDLFPTPAAFPEVSNPIARQAAADLWALSVRTAIPILVHAVGGMGKTVLLESVGRAVGADTHVVMFDGFGAGRWRDPSAPRHLPDRGLVHLANQLAVDGLSEPMLPGVADTAGLLAGFRSRLAQAVENLTKRGKSGGILLLLDAIDHSGERARDTQTDSFPRLLVESLAVAPEPGVRVIASCRSHRRDVAVGSATVEPFEVPAFTREESDAVVLGRVPDASVIERTTVHARSGGNPRLLSTMLNQGRPFEAPPGSPAEGTDEALDRLLAKQVADARANAMDRGASAAELDALLAGLAFLPPPVPIEELAATQALSEEAVRSFAADIFPLIENTPQGLIFRDEPTETFIRRSATQDTAAQEQVLKRLDLRQSVSNYAARALPGVLRDLRRTAALYALASDDRLPATATSGVAQRAIRLARLEAALHVAAVEGDLDQALRFCLDLARLAAGHGRSDGYLRRNPDLVAIADDPEALRRIFEDRGGWGGSRHAALSVIEMMRGNSAEAMRQANRSFEWNDWRARLPDDDDHKFPPFQPFDIVGPAWVAVRHGALGQIGRWFLRWPVGSTYSMSVELIGLLEAHARFDRKAAVARDRLYGVLARLAAPPVVFLLAVLSHGRVLNPDVRVQLLSKMAKSGTPFEEPKEYRLKARHQALAGAVTRAAATALSLGHADLVESILALHPISRPSTHDFKPPTIDSSILVNWLLSGLVRAGAQGREVRVLDLAPRELDVLVCLKRDRETDEAYAAAIGTALEKLKAKAARSKKKAGDWGEPREGPEEGLKGHLTSVVPTWVRLLEGLPGLISSGHLETVIVALYNRTAALVARTNNYSHPQQKRFISDHAGGLADALLWLLRC
ncbi:MAG: hypothetical protein JWM33_3156 [Caulobacteraceae bacterium]|nr:hypothetical protein [Caulobacteraceae bacterium]